MLEMKLNTTATTDSLGLDSVNVVPIERQHLSFFLELSRHELHAVFPAGLGDWSQALVAAFHS